MKAIRVTCPHCGATLRVAEGATTVSCEYCNTPSAVQRRTRILERVVLPPPSVPTNLPRAVQRHSRAWLGFALATVFVPMIVTGVFVTRSVRRATQLSITTSSTNTSHTSTTVRPEDRPPDWQGTDAALVADVDGDGTPELIGRGRRVNAGDVVMLLALDLQTGQPKWTGEPLGTYGDTYRGTLTLAGDLLLFASLAGEVRAFAVATGKPAWKLQLDERVAYFCASTAAAEAGPTIDAVGADDVIRPLARADGAAGPRRDAPKRRGREDVCPRLPSDDTTAYERAKELGYDNRLTKQLGLWIDAVVVGPGGRIAGGSRAKGTHVTTLVRLADDGTELWRQTASADGLGAEGGPRTMVVGDRETCVMYYSKEYRIACFAIADGRRLWDAAAPGAHTALAIVGRSLVVTSSDLRVHDLDTGALRWRRD